MLVSVLFNVFSGVIKVTGEEFTANMYDDGLTDFPNDSNTTVAVTATSGSVLHVPLDEQQKRRKRINSQHEKEKNIFITLSYIIFFYLICWVPFHFVFDISAINPALVPEYIYTFAFWLTYFNSTLNPFLYAYSNKEFRMAFKEVLKCKWIDKT